MEKLCMIEQQAKKGLGGEWAIWLYTEWSRENIGGDRRYCCVVGPTKPIAEARARAIMDAVNYDESEVTA